jgi:pilus assembly protein CpaF
VVARLLVSPGDGCGFGQSSEEIWVNDPSRVFVARAGRHELTSTILNRAQVDELVERMLKSSGRRVDRSKPRF